MTRKKIKIKQKNSRRIQFHANAQFGRSETLIARLAESKLELETMNKKVA